MSLLHFTRDSDPMPFGPKLTYLCRRQGQPTAEETSDLPGS